MLNRALAIIHDEHRSLGAVLHGLRFLANDLRDNQAAPDFKLMWSMIYYLNAFTTRLHDPREDAYLFACLKSRTHEGDDVIATLERQHADSAEHVRVLEHALGQLEAGVSGSLEAFVEQVQQHIEEARQHMSLEEKVVIPLAKKYLLEEDWERIAEAFGENGDPRFGAKPDNEFRDLFTRIVNLAPPPIGVGPTSRS